MFTTQKEIGELLKETRTQNGVSIEEAAEDLNYKLSQLEAIENGDFKNFKDIFLLKCIITDYSKYLGLNPDELIEPKWLIKKFGVLNEIDKEMKKRNSYQGKRVG